MTDAERIELLQEVARVAPKEMGAEFVEDVHSQHEVQADGTVRVISTTGKPYVIFRIEKYNTYPRLYLDDSIEAEDDPIACFAMLDAIQSRMKGHPYRNYTPPIFLRYNGDRDQYTVWEDIDQDGAPFDLLGTGSTRAEAVARAFVHVFGGKV